MLFQNLNTKHHVDFHRGDAVFPLMDISIHST